MKITVTKEDIEKGAIKYCIHCGTREVAQHSGAKPNYCVVCSTVGVYDSHQPVKPFSFILKGVKL